MQGDRLRLCLFDCDGTLVDSQQSIIMAMQDAFASLRLSPPDEDAIRGVIGLSLAEAVAELVHASGTDRGSAGLLVERFREQLIVQRGDGAGIEPMFPGVAEGLARLARSGWLLGLATGKSHASAVTTLADHGLTDHFVTVQTADVAASKPSPEMVYRASAETGVALDRIVVVGDSVHDMRMACNAGVIAAGVDWGYHHPDALRGAGAAVIVSNFAGLTGWLDVVFAAAPV